MMKKLVPAKKKPLTRRAACCQKPGRFAGRFAKAPAKKTGVSSKKTKKTTKAKKRAKTFRSRIFELPGGATMEAVYCPPGTYVMNAQSSGSRSFGREIEVQRTVKFPMGFWLGKSPVTREQWKSVMGSGLEPLESMKHPMTDVTWYDCMKFVATINDARLSYRVSLPTEAQWEYACCAGKSGDPFEKTAIGAWCSANSKGRIHAVGCREPNRWGLYDMLGNVWEWCVDWYDACPRGKTPDSPSSNEYRVCRGGSFVNSAAECKPANRNKINSDDKGSDIGFRLICADVFSDNSGLIVDGVCDILSDDLGVKREQISPSALLEDDLGLIFSDYVEFVLALEEKFGIGISEEDSEKFKTVSDVITYLESRVGMQQYQEE